ncbi:GNAT family N-acetyltransferase [Mucilaginibacter sp.]
MKPDLQPVLSNSIVTLRPLQAVDEVLLQQVANEKELWTYGLADLSRPGELHKYITKAIADREAGHCAVWTIYDHKSNQVAGCTRLFDIDRKDERGQIGATWIGQSWQGTGLNQAMKYELLTYAFEVLQLNRVEFRVDERNMRSRAAVQRTGAHQEGILRQHMKTHDGYLRNTVFYSILKSEWPRIRQKNFTHY